MKKLFSAAIWACAGLLLFSAGCSRSSKEDLLQQGLEQRLAQNHHGAIVLFKSVLEKDPNDYRARFYLADEYLQLGKFEIAEKEFHKVAMQSPSFPELPLKLAELYNRTRRPELAVQEIGSYLKANPDSVDALQLMGKACMLKGDTDAAEKSFRQALRLAPQKAPLILDLADCLLHIGKREEARVLLRELTAREPDNAAANFLLARVESSFGQREQALRLYRRVSELDPGNSTALYMAGLLLLENGKTDDADALAGQLLEKFPGQPQGRQLKGYVCYLRGDIEAAVNDLQKVAEQRPDLLTWYMLGMSYYKLGHLEMAINQFQRILDHQPDAAQPRIVLAAILLRQKRVDDAIAALRRVLEKDGKNALAHSTLGSAYLSKGQLDQAMEEFDRAIDLNPTLAEAYLKKGLSNLSAGDLEQAEGNMVKALAIAPEIPDIRLVLARYYLQQKNYPEAIRILREGLTGKESDALFYNYLAASYFGERNFDQGVECLLKAKELKPDYLTPYYNLAAYYAGKGDFPKSIAEYRSILGRQPGALKPLLLLGLTSELAGQEEAAAGWYRQAKDSGQAAGYLGLANYLQRAGKTAEAIATLDELIRKDPKNTSACELKGRIQLAARQFQAAIETFTLLDRLAPGRGAGLLTEAYLQQGDNEKAAEVSQRLIRQFPGVPLGYLCLSSVQEKAGQLGEAITLLKEAARRIDNNLPLRLRLGELYEKSGNLQAAVQTYEGISQAQPDCYPALFALGAVYERLGKREQAIRLYRQALAHNADFAPALNNLAYCYAESSEHRQEALELASRAYRMQPENPWVLDTMGYVLFSNGRTAEACQVLEKAATLLPDMPTIQYHLALIYERQGKIEHSLRSLRYALAKGSFPEADQARAMLQKLSGKVSAGKL